MVPADEGTIIPPQVAAAGTPAVVCLPQIKHGRRDGTRCCRCVSSAN